MAYRTLEMTLISAKDLKAVNLFSRMDVYAIASIAGDPRSRQRTPADTEGGKNPTWNRTFTFTVPDQDPGGIVFHVVLRSERALGDRDVGEVHVPLRELLDASSAAASAPAGDEKKTAPHYVSYQVLSPHSGKPKGVLNISYKFSNLVTVAAPPVTRKPGPAGAYLPPAPHYTPDPANYYPPPMAYNADAYPPPAPRKSDAYPPPTPHKCDDPVTAYTPQASPKSNEHMTAYPGPNASTAYPPPGGYSPQYAPLPQGGYPYGPPPPHSGYGAYPPLSHGGYGGYPPPPQGGYGYGGYPPQQGAYGYGATPQQVAQPAKKNKMGGMGMGLGAGLLGGAIGGMILGDMVSDAADGFGDGMDF